MIESSPMAPAKAMKFTMAAMAVTMSALMLGCGSVDSGKAATLRKELLALRITEIQYYPADVGAQLGDDYEFIEIKNTGSATVSLNKVAFTDGIEYAFPEGATLGGGEFLVLAANADKFEERYDFAPFGEYSGKLSDDGEKIEISDVTADEEITLVEYANRSPWPAQAAGSGFSIVPAYGDGGNGWRSSFEVNGSPGKDDPGVVLINEVLSHTDPPAKDAIELFNPNPQAIDVGGWYLSDKQAEPAKFRIPSGTVIPANGYKVLDEDDFDDPASATRFNLGAHGDDVWLSADSTGCRASYCQGFSFGEIENGTSFGRTVTSNGEVHFAAQKEPSLGSVNAGPRTGPLVISEVMYHPADERNEFLELKNVGGGALDMFDRDNPANVWRIDGIGFKFPAAVTLEAGEVVLVISDTISEPAFRSTYGVAASVRIFKMTKMLSNSSDTLEVAKPEEPYTDSSTTPAKLKVPYKTIERLVYHDNSPWPKEADAGGSSLVRIELRDFAADPANWKAAKPSPGKVE
jgi:hypothetical protein